MVENKKVTTVLLCGVGGQGTILAADLLAHTAMAAGCDVKLSEIHGMAQRGGAVVTVVRFGEEVPSMVADSGAADHVVAFETTEALRNIPFLKADGSLLVNEESIKPLPVLTGKAKMPAQACERLASLNASLIPADELAEKAGNLKASNVVLLGALAYRLDFDPKLWEEQIVARVPSKFTEVNLAAFKAGLEYVQDKEDK